MRYFCSGFEHESRIAKADCEKFKQIAISRVRQVKDRAKRRFGGVLVLYSIYTKNLLATGSSSECSYSMRSLFCAGKFLEVFFVREYRPSLARTGLKFAGEFL